MDIKNINRANQLPTTWPLARKFTVVNNKAEITENLSKIIEVDSQVGKELIKALVDYKYNRKYDHGHTSLASGADRFKKILENCRALGAESCTNLANQLVHLATNTGLFLHRNIPTNLKNFLNKKDSNIQEAIRGLSAEHKKFLQESGVRTDSEQVAQDNWANNADYTYNSLKRANSSIKQVILHNADNDQDSLSMKSTQASLLERANSESRQVTIAEVEIDFNPTAKPNKIPNIEPVNNLVIGDLHGNFTKLVSFCVQAGLLNIDDKDYVALVKDPNLISDYIYDKKITVSNRDDFKLTLLGDIFADRNPNDKAKLKLLELLSDNGVNLAILYSNHDEAFYNHVTKTKVNCEPAHRTFIEDDTRDTFKQIFDKHYTFFDYEDGENLFSHAPLSHFKFNELCKKLNDAELSDPKTPFKRKIEIINSEFKQSFANLGIFTPYVWQRKAEWAKADCSLAAANLVGGPKVHYSGHDSYQATKFNTSIDNINGKDPSCQGVGTEKVLLIRK